MDLKIKDVAELLSVSETTIRRWLVDGKIPAYKLNRQYRFSRIEIENWMMSQKIAQEKPEELLVQGEVEIYNKAEGAPKKGSQQFSLYRALNRGNVIVSIEGSTKEEVIRQATSQIAEKLKLDPDVVADLLLDRENLMPTSLNNGIGIPHARECIQQNPFDLVSIVYPKKPIEYGAMDGKPVHALFFLFATGDKIHLHLLGKIAHFSSNPKALALLSAKADKTTLLEFIREWEGSIKVGGAD